MERAMVAQAGCGDGSRRDHPQHPPPTTVSSGGSSAGDRCGVGGISNHTVEHFGAMRSGEDNDFGTTANITTLSTSTTAALSTTPTTGGGAGIGLLPPLTAGEADPGSSLSATAKSCGSNPNIGSMSASMTGSGTANTVSAMEQAEEFVKPIFKDGEIILEVECGQNKAAMYLSKLCQGSKGPCISFQGSWLTPNEFQFVSGRETAKDWKRSIRHHGKSLKLLLAKGILSVHPTMCDCEGCRIGAVLTRKGEKRRIPNGERKRKSTSSTPENSGSGAFRAVGSVSKSPEGSLDAKRLPLDRFIESGQSPLKESSVMNLPQQKDLPSMQQACQGQDVEIEKAVTDTILASPLHSLITSERVSDINGNTTMGGQLASTLLMNKDTSDSAARCMAAADTVRLEKDRHTHTEVPAAVVPAVEPVLDVKVLSSSSVSCATSTSGDKSLSRLALHHAAVISTVSSDAVLGVKVDNIPEPLKCENGSAKEERLNTELRLERPTEPTAVSKDTKKLCTGDQKLAKSEDNSVSVAVPVSPSCVKDKKCDSKDRQEEKGRKGAASLPSVSHPSVPQSLTTGSARHVHSSSNPQKHCTSARDPQKHTASSRDPQREEKQKHSSSTFCASSSFPPSSSSTPSKPSDKQEHHHTTKHTSSEHRPEDTTFKHSSSKPTKDHASEKNKERRLDGPSSVDKDRHSSRDKETSSRPADREADKRRLEERSPEKDRRSITSLGSATKSAFSADKVDPVPAIEYQATVGRAESNAEAAAFSDYMRVLAAGHHNMVPPPTACLPPMFPLRPPDVSVSSAMLHPMHACGMFSSPSALLQKDPVLYPTSAGTMPGYGNPSVSPYPLIPPQFTSAAPTSVLDYSRPFPYLTWNSGFPLMVPDAMSAAAAAAAANASAKRSREEADSAVDLSAKRLRFDQQYAAATYGPIPSMDYMSAYRSIPSLSCGMESSMYDKNAEYFRKRCYPDFSGSAVSNGKGMDSPYMASLPDYYRALYCCGCMENRPEDVRTWSVEDVVKFVSSLDGCSVYAEIFREQRVDGKILVLLTVEHLMKSLGMKLGPAVLLTERVAKILQESTRTSGCDMCKRLASMVPAVHSVGY